MWCLIGDGLRLPTLRRSEEVISALQQSSSSKSRDKVPLIFLPCRIKHKLFFTVLVLSIIFCNGPLGALEEPEGFRGIKWGEHIRNVLGMKKVSVQEDIDIYRREGDRLEIDGTEVLGIEYYFFKNRFMGLYIYFDDFKRFTAIRNWTIRTYGPGEKKDFYLNKYTWWTKNLLITLNYDARANSGSLLYCYLPLWYEKIKAKGDYPH